MSLEVIKSGIFTLLQDKGRYGYTNKGFTQSGVMDEISYNILNDLLSNDKNTNCLEIAFGNIELRSNTDTFIATSGAACELFINDKAKQNYMVHKIKVGDSIKIKKLLKAQRVYLGVKGGFNINKELDSNSTTIKESLGGLDGEKIKDGDILPCKSYKELPLKRLKQKYKPKFEDEIVLRVILGYQIDNFPKEEQEKFFSQTYEITPAFDRMGCKLKGEAIKCDIEGIVSEAISFGAIQIPANGQPIILLKDRQTIGGYPKIGSVLPIDCYKLAQMGVGGRVRFQIIDLDDGVEVMKGFYK